MADTSLQPMGAPESRPGGRKNGKSAERTQTTDLEKPGRGTEPLAALPSARKEPGRINVGRPERMVSLIGGAALIAYGTTRRDWAGLALALSGAGLALRGATGHCSVYRGLDINTAAGDSRETNGVHVEQAITIDKSAEELYRFWRDFSNHALISDYLASVTVLDDKRSHWVAKGPANKLLEWDAEVINDRPSELIAWKTLPGADIDHAGTVRFKPGPAGRGTEVHVTMQYYPPAGTVGAGIAMLLHREPSIQAADMLKRLKRLMETGEIVRVDGQSHGQSLQRTAWNPKS